MLNFGFPPRALQSLMLLTSRQFLVIFLVLLQFIAPLVHAHTREQISDNAGLHVPGLETYSLALGSNEALPKAMMSKPAVHAEGVLIAVDSGIRDPNAIQAPTYPDLFVLSRAEVFTPQPAIALGYPARQNPPPTKILLIFACAPRAPPAQYWS